MNVRVRVVAGIRGPIIIGAWCPRCRQEAMPVSLGRCGWCDTRIVDEHALKAAA